MAIETKDFFASKALDSTPTADTHLFARDAVTGDYVRVPANVLGASGNEALPFWRIPCTDRVTPIPAANNIMSDIVPFDMNITEIIAYLADPTVSGTFEVRVKINGSTVFSTNVTIDAGEKSSITGTPAVISNGAWTKGQEITVDVVDDADGTATGLILYFIQGEPADLTPTISTTSLPNGTDDVAYSQTVNVTGGNAPIGFAVQTGSLPTGLSLNTSTGAITGTPTTPGTYNFTIRATDADGDFDDQALSIVIDAAPSIAAGAIHDWNVSSLSALADGDPVGSWVDTVAALAITAAGGVRPTYETAVTPTGAPVVRFDGTDDTLKDATGVTGAKHIFIVAAFRPATNPAASGLMSINSGSGYFYEANGGALDFYSIFGPHHVNGVQTETFPGSGQFAVYDIVLDSAITGDIALGQGRDGQSRYGAWDIARVIIYDDELTGSDLTGTRATLTDLYVTP